MGNIDPNKMMYKSDRINGKYYRTIQDNYVILVATQESRRSRKKRTMYIYNIENTNIIVFNRSRNGIRFMKIAIRPENMKKFYEIFVQKPLTPKEQEWLTRYDYTLINND